MSHMTRMKTTYDSRYRFKYVEVNSTMQAKLIASWVDVGANLVGADLQLA